MRGRVGYNKPVIWGAPPHSLELKHNFSQSKLKRTFQILKTRFDTDKNSKWEHKRVSSGRQSFKNSPKRLHVSIFSLFYRVLGGRIWSRVLRIMDLPSENFWKMFRGHPSLVFLAVATEISYRLRTMSHLYGIDYTLDNFTEIGYAA